MGIARSTDYDEPGRAADDTALVEVMHAIKDEFEAYGWRRMQAALGQRGWVANHKKLKRLMREHGLNARRRRRYVTTTDSDHDQPIFPNRTKGRFTLGEAAGISAVRLVGLELQRRVSTTRAAKVGPDIISSGTPSFPAASLLRQS